MSLIQKIYSNRSLFKLFTYLLYCRKQFQLLIDRKEDKENLMVNVGGGYFFKRHWRILDYTSEYYNYQRMIIDYFFNLASNKPFPFKNNEVKFFFSSHTVEHIPQEYCQNIFNEIYRCLKPGGAVRIVTPDFDWGYEAYSKKNYDFFVDALDTKDINKKFLYYFASYFTDIVPSEELKRNFQTMSRHEFADYYTQRIPRESQAKHTGNHISWWNYDKMSSMMKEAGFTTIYRSKAGDSNFNEMRDEKNGFTFDRHPTISLIVEAVK